ncbi:MAG: DUF2339 domain-containing protein, partial [Verrucomicrobiota bacterium]|nr:DUF2339 domain-containing protein [Verrucomicrobiota bacterium]
METLILLFAFGGLAVVIFPFVLSFVQARKIRGLQTTIERLAQRITTLELERQAAPVRAAPAGSVAPTPPAPAPAPPAESVPVVQPSAATHAAVPPPLPTPLPPPSPRKPAVPAIDWEAFMGVKLFAWLGGFALFLGVVFLVKYSFENNLITPFMRVVLGAFIGLGLIGAGWFTAQRNYRVPGQSLCATGVLVLYAVTFGAHAFYGLVSLPTAFLFMSTVTVTVFTLAVRLDAQVVVILGLLGGFLTPPLLTNAEDDPLRLFGYVALLNAGIAAVALRKRWDYLLILAAIGTVITQWGWVPWYDSGRAAAGFFVFLALQAQFLAIAWMRQRLEPAEKWSTLAAVTVGFSSLGFAMWLLTFESLATRARFFFGFTFLADVGLLALAVKRRNPARLAGLAGAAMFTILAAWTAAYLKPDLLWWALGAYLLFAVIHAGFSVWPKRAEAPGQARTWESYVPLLALVLLFLCVFGGETSFAVWLCVLLVNVVAVWLAWTTRSVKALLAALVATLATAALWIVTAPPVKESVTGILMVVGGFGVFFATASTFLTRRLGLGGPDPRTNVPAIAAATPFILLLMLVAKLPIPDPTLVFGVALLLAIVLLGLGIVARTSWIAAVALAFTWAVEREWHSLHFSTAAALLALGWYVAFWLLFTAYPFFSAEERARLPWAVGALSGVLHFSLVYDVVSVAYPTLRNGLLPVVFVLPYAFGVWYVINRRGIPPASGDARLAWQGGAALLFVSLVFPVQFQREWITLGWALEGVALLALFRVVPNAGLRIVGAALLSVAFVRLALNPAVLEYHPRAPVRIWNWYLYAYGVTSICSFAGARLVQGFRGSELARIVPRLLYTLGAILTFLLLNIQIADYFSVGPTLTFSFTGDFARDMTYSIAWALFAFALLLIGMKQKTKAVRYAGLALLFVTLVKLFLHDLANLGQLYRIGAFIGVA